MQLAKRKFTFGDPDDDVDDDLWLMQPDKTVALCNETLDAVFDIPHDVSVIWLSLHNRPAANRVVLEVVMVPWDDDIASDCVVRLPEFFDNRFSVDEKLNPILAPLCGKAVYLDCEYLA